MSNREEVIQKKKVWREKNKEHIREYTKKWRDKNRDYFRRYMREWYAKNKEKVRLVNTVKRKANPEKTKIRDWSKRRRKKILSELGSFCNNCNSTNGLQIHHNKYTNNLEDMEVLCSFCHAQFHFKIKKKVIRNECFFSRM